MLGKIDHEDVREAFTQYHHLEALAIASLSKSSLIDDMLWCDREDATYLNVGVATRALLDWGLQELVGKGTMTAATSYETLDLRYRQQLSVSAYAREYDLAIRTIQRRRLAGTKRLATIFQQELAQANDVEQRLQMTFDAHYARLTAEAQRFLHLLALLEEPISLMPNNTSLPTIDHNDYTVLQQIALMRVDETEKVYINGEVKPYVIAQMAEEEMQMLSRLIANHHLGNQNSLDAAAYLLMADDHQLAAETLLSIDDNGILSTLSPIKELLQQFSREDVSRDTWGELQYLNGRVLGLTDSIPESIKAYEDALEVGDEAVKAKSHFMLAIAYHRKGDPTVVLTHANVGIEIIRKQSLAIRDIKLLIRLYLVKAMLYTSGITDYEQAREALVCAESIANESGGRDGREWLAILSDIELHWGRYEHQVDNVDEALRRYMQSYVYALEADEVRMQMKIAYYLGVVYSYGRQSYQEALRYFYEAAELAEQSGQDYFLASTRVSIANCLYNCEQYEEAVQHLQDVHVYAQKTDNNYMLTLVLFNFALVYLRWGKIKQGMTHYNALCEMGTWLDTSYLTLCLNNIQEEFPFVDSAVKGELNERQFRGLVHAQKDGRLTRQEYVTINRVSKSVASDELTALVTAGWCERHASGRATHYKLVPREPQ